MHFSRLLFFFSLSLMLSSTSLSAQSRPSVEVNDTLTVAIAGSEPFVIQNQSGGSPEGIAIEIWEDLANEKGWPFRYKPFNSVGEALNALDGGGADLVVGPVSITSQRAAQVRFSQPYYQSSLTIVSRDVKAGIWDRIKPLFSFKLLIAVGVFLVILAIVGALLWLAERRGTSEQFPDKPINGIGNGMWLAIVTMTTVGYGDKAPTTLAGRIIAGSWMIISIIFATSMVAGIASTLTLTAGGTKTIINVEQLGGKKAATISGSPAETFLAENNTKEVAVENLNEAMSKLHDKEVDAVVYDRPQLLYYLQNHKDDGLHISNAEYYKQGYGFAFPLNSELVYEVNRQLLSLAEDGTVKNITADYLGKEE